MLGIPYKLQFIRETLFVKAEQISKETLNVIKGASKGKDCCHHSTEVEN